MGAAVGMALAGLRPVVEMRVVDFALCAMDELVNQAAKNRYMFGGQGRVPLVARMPIGLWTRVGGAAFAVAGGLVRAHPGPRRRGAVDARRQLRPAARRAGVAATPSSTWSTRSCGARRRGRAGQPRAAGQGARRARRQRTSRIVSWSRTVHVAPAAAAQSSRREASRPR